MNSERDILIKYIFPELRYRARNLNIDLREVDLRWGITEAESNSDKYVVYILPYLSLEIWLCIFFSHYFLLVCFLYRKVVGNLFKWSYQVPAFYWNPWRTLWLCAKILWPCSEQSRFIMASKVSERSLTNGTWISFSGISSSRWSEGKRIFLH